MAQFDDFATAESVADELVRHGCSRDDLSQFMLNAPGQHHRFPIGGDEDADSGAKEGEQGAIVGAAVGAVAGLALGAAALPIVGPVAAALAGLGVGAYTGSFAGAVEGMGDEENQTPSTILPRPAGVRLAVRAASPELGELAIEFFKRYSAKSIEEAQGTWRSGAWSDFDPVSTPQWIQPPPN